MENLTPEQVRGRIAQLERERDAFVKDVNAQINRRIGEFSGAIAVWAELLRRMENEQNDDGIRPDDTGAVRPDSAADTDSTDAS